MGSLLYPGYRRSREWDIAGVPGKAHNNSVERYHRHAASSRPPLFWNRPRRGLGYCTGRSSPAQGTGHAYPGAPIIPVSVFPGYCPDPVGFSGRCRNVQKNAQPGDPSGPEGGYPPRTPLWGRPLTTGDRDTHPGPSSAAGPFHVMTTPAAGPAGVFPG